MSASYRAKHGANDSRFVSSDGCPQLVWVQRHRARILCSICCNLIIYIIWIYIYILCYAVCCNLIIYIIIHTLCYTVCCNLIICIIWTYIYIYIMLCSMLQSAVMAVQINMLGLCTHRPSWISRGQHPAAVAVSSAALVDRRGARSEGASLSVGPSVPQRCCP